MYFELVMQRVDHAQIFLWILVLLYLLIIHLQMLGIVHLRDHLMKFEDGLDAGYSFSPLLVLLAFQVHVQAVGIRGPAPPTLDVFI